MVVDKFNGHLTTGEAGEEGDGAMRSVGEVGPAPVEGGASGERPALEWKLTVRRFEVTDGGGKQAGDMWVRVGSDRAGRASAAIRALPTRSGELTPVEPVALKSDQPNRRSNHTQPIEST